MLLGKRALLYSVFNPKTVAVIGASAKPGSLAHTTLATLLDSPFGGAVFAVEPGQAKVLGVQAYPSISVVPAPVDLAVVVAPAEHVPDIVGECTEARVKSAIVISDSFGRDPQNCAALEQKIAENLSGSRMRLIGPGRSGVINPPTGLNASSGLPMPLGGSVAFLSQSHAIGRAILEWSPKQIVGFSAFVCVGDMLDVGWGDLIDYFGSDPETHSIVVYMESIGSARSFLSAAREVSLDKPIIVIKAVRSEAAMHAGGSQAGVADDDEVLDAAFRRVGVLRVEKIEDLFCMADVLSKQPRPLGPRLMAISNAPEASRLAADSVIATGGELAELSPASREQLDKVLSHHNDDDSDAVACDGNPEDYVKAIEIAAQDANCDGLLLLTLPQSISDPRKATDLLLTMRKPVSKPVLACFIGGEMAAAQENLTRACIPTFSSTHDAARAFQYMWQYSYSLRAIYETPVLHGDVTEAGFRKLAENIIHGARDCGRTVLTEIESNQLLATYRLPTLPLRIARSEDEAIRIAAEIGYPVIFKLNTEAVPAQVDPLLTSPLIDAEAIRTRWKRIAAGLADTAASGDSVTISLQPMVEVDGYELRIASKVDPQFGPVLIFGSGGKLAEIFQDRAVGLAPLNATLARRVMEQTKFYSALQGGGGRKVDLSALEAFLVRFSQLLVEQPLIKEIEINPLLASPQRLLALNARIVVHGPEVNEGRVTKPAIRPYPVQHVSSWMMKDGQVVTIRPIRPEDEPLMIKFHERLSDRSVYLRYFQALGLKKRTAHDRLTRICFIDYDREMALVAERRVPETEERQIIAIGNLLKVHGHKLGEVAVITRDECQGKGLATEIFRRLVLVAREEKLQRLVATTMAENGPMCAVMKRLGFHLSENFEDHEVEGVLAL
jgi:acetyltransferase